MHAILLGVQLAFIGTLVTIGGAVVGTAIARKIWGD